MEVINISYYKKHGLEYILGSFQGKLCLLSSINGKNTKKLKDKLQKKLNAKFTQREDDILKEAKKQFDEYFKGKRKNFDIPLLLTGTEFQKKAWEILLKIPYGKTANYKEQSRLIGNEKAVRAVANANGANPIAIIVPCHRIIGSGGSLTGYAGGMELKKRLLELESSYE
jgi:methylated-DNA-[protein]-cysteine S-methyltransferase